MRFRVLIFIALALLASAGLVSAQTISIDHIDGSNGPEAVQMGVPITFHIRLSAEGASYAGITNGFRIYSPTGAEWDTTLITKTKALNWQEDSEDWDFDLTYLVKKINTDGMLSDTVGIVGAVMNNPIGIPADFDSVTHLITIGPIDQAYEGGTICIDSCFYYPSGVWKWAGSQGNGNVSPNWGFGTPPYCFFIGQEIIDPPVIDCPTEPYAPTLCEPQEICLSLPITDANTVVVTGDIAGATWADGEVCFDSPELDGTYNLHVEATNDGGTADCDLVWNLTYRPDIEMTCPDGPVDVDLCELGEVHVSVPVANADIVGIISDATWSNGELIFTPSTAGTYIFWVHALELFCGEEDSCMVTVNVNVTDPPEITCPQEVINIPVCGPGTYCVDLPISGATGITVENANGSWVDGQLCINVTEGGSLVPLVTATNCAGSDQCYVYINVHMNGAPTVVLEDKDPALQCEPAAILLAYTPEDLDGDELTEELIAPAGGSIDTETNIVSFTPTGDGTYEVIVQVTDPCGAVAADTTYVEVDIMDPPVITCPDGPIDVNACEPGEICIDLPITDNYDEMTITGDGTWDAGSFCFQADAAGSYEFTVEVVNMCHEASCTFTVNVAMGAVPTIDCPTETIVVNQTHSGEATCIPLAVDGQTSVGLSDYPDGWTVEWADDQLCFDASTPGTYSLSINAGNDCGEAVCSPTIEVVECPLPEIICPAGPLAMTLCEAGEACIELLIEGANDVQVLGATWVNDTLCFTADVPGSYNFEVTATNDCGSVQCDLNVDVDYHETAPAEFSVEPTGESSLEVALTSTSTGWDLAYSWDFGDGGASTEANPVHSFAAEGCYDVTLTVTDGCNRISDITHEVCVTGEQVVVPSDRWIVVGATDPTIDGVPFADGAIVTAYDQGGTLCGMTIYHSRGIMTLTVYGDSPYTLDLDEGMDLDEVIRFRVDGVEVFPMAPIAWDNVNNPTPEEDVFSTEATDCPVIDCPTEPIELMLCEFEGPCEVCFELPMDYVGSVEIDYPGATWANDTLCFTADTIGTYTFHVIAYGEQPGCEPVACDLEVIVTEWVYHCSQMVLSGNEFHFSMGYLDTENPDPQYLYVTTPDDPFCYDLVQSGGFTWLSIAPDGCTGDEIALVVDGFNLQAGSYSSTIAVVADDYEICDPAIQYLTVYLDVLPPVSEEDIIHIPTVPSVPGARVAVPIRMENPCDVTGVLATFEYYTDQFEYDSASFAGSSLADWAASVTVDGRQITVDAEADGGTAVAPGNSLMVTLWFTVDHMAAENFYAIDAIDAIFETDCYAGDGTTPVEPTIVPGGIIIGAGHNYICGYVVDPDMHPIEGATVELWGDFPTGSAEDIVFSNATGLFEFFNSTVDPFDVHAYKAGYYPATAWNRSYDDGGILIVLTPIEEVIPTDMWINLYCGANLYMNEPLPVGSVVDAYDPDGVHCGSFTVAEAGAYGFMPVYRDDPYTSGIDEGADVNDIIRVYVDGLEAYHTVTPIWTSNGDVQEICLEVADTVTQQIELAAGWNLVSWRVNTEDDEIASVLASLGDDLDVVLGFEGGGLTYDPDMPLFSTLYTADHYSGYWIKVDRPVTLDIVGSAVPATTPIDVDPGWNLVSYLPTDILEPDEALGGLGAALKIALGYDGGYQAYEPGEDLTNTLEEMAPGHGYWLRVDRPASLIYPGGGPVLAPQAGSEPVFAKAASDLETTKNWMNIYTGDLRLDGSLVSAGATITAHNAGGDKVGSFTLAQDGLFGFMAVYGDDETTDRHEGVSSGESFTLRVNGVETNESFTWTAHGDRVEIGELTAKSGSSTDALPNSFRLMQNYPNPFNPSTVIGFSLPTAGKAKVEVFNILGRQVATVFDDMASAGYNEVTWDGRSSNGKLVSSGIYFYRLTTNAYTETRKMTLLK